MKMKMMCGQLLILFILFLNFSCATTGGPRSKEKEEVSRPPTGMEVIKKESSGSSAEKTTQAVLPEKEKTAEKKPPAKIEEKSQPSSPVSFAPPLPIKKPAEVAKGSKIVLNFDNADLHEVIRVIADMLKINYLVDPRVKGTVNIHTSGQITPEGLLAIFQSILRLNGATAIQKEGIYEIVPLAEAKRAYTHPTLKIPEHLGPEDKYSIQIVPLKFIPVAEVAKMIKPFLSEGADIVEHPAQNILIIGDLAANIKKTVAIIEIFDVDIFADMRIRIYPIMNADVNEIAKEMERIFSSLEINVKSGRGVGITFTPIQRINSLLVVSSIPQIFEKVEKWLQELDKTPPEGTKLGVFVYYVQNGKAKDLAEVLKQVYVPTKDKKDFKEKVVTPAPTAPARAVRPTTAPPATPSPAPATPPKEEKTPLPEGSVPEGEITIVVDETTNALIIRAYPRDYKAILETIKKLDLYPKQVFIEVFLAEVTLTDLTKYGLEFSTFTDTFVQGVRPYTYTVGMGGVATPETFSSGLRYSIASTDRLFAAIHASATENRLKMISSPHILASNNKEAKIQIGKAQPILTTTYTTTATTSPSVVEGTIEYKDIGIILTVTPRISDAKLVTMEINLEQSDVASTKLGSLDNIPVFKKKTAKTTLSIMEGQTIVIGGLIEDKKESGASGVPFLSRLPIIGALFGYQTRDINKTETVLLLTPHVITDLEESNQVTREFREKVQGLKKELEKTKEKK